LRVFCRSAQKQRRASGVRGRINPRINAIGGARARAVPEIEGGGEPRVLLGTGHEG
jgi:hypothetical protein